MRSGWKEADTNPPDPGAAPRRCPARAPPRYTGTKMTKPSPPTARSRAQPLAHRGLSRCRGPARARPGSRSGSARRRPRARSSKPGQARERRSGRPPAARRPGGPRRRASPGGGSPPRAGRGARRAPAGPNRCRECPVAPLEPQARDVRAELGSLHLAAAGEERAHAQEDLHVGIEAPVDRLPAHRDHAGEALLLVGPDGCGA